MSHVQNQVSLGQPIFRAEPIAQRAADLIAGAAHQSQAAFMDPALALVMLFPAGALALFIALCVDAYRFR